MAERLRVRCPLCGMHPFLEDLAKVAEEQMPAQVRVFVLKMGGKVPPDETGEIPQKKGRGKAPGKMKMEDVTDLVPNEVAKMEAFFKGRADEFLAGLEEK